MQRGNNDEARCAASPAQQVVKRRWSFKTVVLGDSGVGKTWLVETALTCQMADAAEPKEPAQHHQYKFHHNEQQLERGEGDADERGTIGVTFNLAKLELDGSTVLLQVWDTSGKDRYRGLLANYMTDLSCIVIAYNPCCDSAEACCRSLASWHQFAQEASVKATRVESPTAPAMFCVVAIGGDGCSSPHTCDHVRCLAVGRAFAETLRGRFFQCRRLEAGARCDWLRGEELSAQWLGRELLRRHFSFLVRLMEQEEENCGAAGAMKESSCCQRLLQRLQELVRLPALAAFLLSRQLMPQA